MPSRVGDFKSDQARAHFLDVYRAAMTGLPTVSESQDVSTSFGTVRVYRFGEPAERTPVMLLPGRNASTPMWRGNIVHLLQHRPVFGVDLLGEAGLSVQRKPIAGPNDEAQWLDETLAGLGLSRVHLMGVSIGGWTATNYAVRRPGRAASLVLLDPVFTFAPIAIKAVLASPALFLPGVPAGVRKRVLSWISGGADIDEAASEAALISAGSSDYTVRKAMPTMTTDEQLRSLDIPVLALIGGRSVMHDAERAAERARSLLARGQVELWRDASHAINGEYAVEIAERAADFWKQADRRN
ncbi:alpha/beta hydrolase [Mycobacterium sp. IS-3022]|uniref:alpha/beta fold hydrolase n=1 Tax=Mycobacterium sp. IS-3022 TaxID=1772277 RepID=UPI000741748C|nr:alpha/beta hydrolase [Mycobacterium sp. IS-3022]KUH95594.1 carboxylesterase [Mycobacterium sp. IS-3022]